MNALEPLSEAQDELYMQKALQVAQTALGIGEVPVGCVIVKRVTHVDSSGEHHLVVISHGANQVNATRDATRHAELVAIDRMLTGGASSDQLRLPMDVIGRPARSHLLPANSPLRQSDTTQLESILKDKWLNEPSDRNHWKNTYGWGSGRRFAASELSECYLYVTCEPCIMCAAALSQVGIGRVIFGCCNDKFGGCGSILNLHETGDLSPTATYPVQGGILADKAVSLLQSFYKRENFNAPDEKRRRKESPGVG